MKVSITFDSLEEALTYGISFNPPGEVAAKAEKPAPKKAAKKPAAAKKEESPAEEETDEEASLDTLKVVFQALVKGGKREEALELLKKYKVKKIHEVAEEDMPAMQADAQALLDDDAEADPFG